MSKEYIEIFKKKTNSLHCQTSGIKRIVSSATGSTEVVVKRTSNAVKVNLIINNNKEGLEQAKIICNSTDDLQVGDYITWNNNTFLLTDQDNNVLFDTTIHKYKARQCNIIFKYNNVSYDGIFLGSSTAKISYDLDGNSNTNEIFNTDNRTVLIFSGNNIKQFDDCLINNTQWKIIDWDNITANPIVYATIDKVPNSIDPKTPIPEPTTQYYAGLTYSFPTQDYYFTCEQNIKVSKFKDEIKITMPYGISTLTFDTKNNGTVVTNNIQIGVL